VREIQSNNEREREAEEEGETDKKERGREKAEAILRSDYETNYLKK
jgi:hypothetical protein